MVLKCKTIALETNCTMIYKQSSYQTIFVENSKAIEAQKKLSLNPFSYFLIDNS